MPRTRWSNRKLAIPLPLGRWRMLVPSPRSAGGVSNFETLFLLPLKCNYYWSFYATKDHNNKLGPEKDPTGEVCPICPRLSIRFHPSHCTANKRYSRKRQNAGGSTHWNNDYVTGNEEKCADRGSLG